MRFDITSGTRYHLIADAIREQILASIYPPGSLLPSEESLSFDFGHSRDTVRDALDVLRAEGLVVKERGRRAMVAPVAERTAVALAAGSSVTARMPLRTELLELGCRAQTPLLVQTRPGGTVVLHPADRVQLVVTT
ncbi:winged helix-turn-helix domain-containing protein [Dactylosporangium sp. NPDC051485]|uniref:winged helix-turn-helix domain-containing protein n=1 Tax=Dactylosporangium sp. NPDC051485 TaxID=3154846 RepID=UPI00342AFE9C